MGLNRHHYEDYAASVIGRYVSEIRHLAPAVRRRVDIEPLHQIRIASRSLRNALKVFNNLFSPSQTERWFRSIRKFTKSSGRARALDTFINFLERSKDTSHVHLDQQSLRQLILTLQAERSALQPQILAALAEIRRKKVLEEMTRALAVIRHSPTKQGGEKLLKVGEKKIKKRLLQMLSFEAYVHRPKCMTKLHQLRIAAKHLRYTLEDLQGFYGKAVNDFITEARTIQRFLGEMHDFDERILVLRNYLKQRPQDASSRKTVARLRKECEQLRDQAYRKFFHVWQQSRREKTWEQMRKFIADVKAPDVV